MIYQKIQLNEYDKHASSEAKLEIYLHGDEKIRPTMLVVPGGGYHFIAQSEGKPVALRYLSEGFNCFVLSYVVCQAFPAPHIDLACAVKYIREKQKEFHLDGNLFMVGFSAGGHLIGSYSYLYKELSELINCGAKILKPEALIISYAVITMKKETHSNSRNYVTGGDETLDDKFCIEKHVSKDYPPTFIWTTWKDTIVDPKNTIMMAEALEKNGVIYEKYIFDNLNHGTNVMSMDTREKPRPFTDDDLACKVWVDKSINFIVNNFYKK